MIERKLARRLAFTEMWQEFDECVRVHLMAELRAGVGRVWGRAAYVRDPVVIGA